MISIKSILYRYLVHVNTQYKLSFRCPPRNVLLTFSRSLASFSFTTHNRASKLRSRQRIEK